MFHQFYDNHLHSFLLGKIESYYTKTVGENLFCLILNLDGSEKILEYNEYTNLVSDVEALHNALNDYYLMVMEKEAGPKENVMGYGTCGDGIGTEYVEEEELDQEEDTLIGFKIPKKSNPPGPRNPIC